MLTTTLICIIAYFAVYVPYIIYELRHAAEFDVNDETY